MADFIVPFPPEKGWSVVSDMGFHTFDPGCSPGEAELFLLVQVTPEGGYTGSFRFLLCADMTFSCQVQKNPLANIPLSTRTGSIVIDGLCIYKAPHHGASVLRTVKIWIHNWGNEFFRLMQLF